jgi:hypothetical protein
VATKDPSIDTKKQASKCRENIPLKEYHYKKKWQYEQVKIRSYSDFQHLLQGNY